MFQDGSNGEPTGQRPERADTEARRRRIMPGTIEQMVFHERIESPNFGCPPIHAGPRPESIGGPAHRRSTSDRGSSPAPIRFPPDNFKLFLTLSSKSFSCFPCGSWNNGDLTFSGAPFQGKWAWSAAEDASSDYNSDNGAARFQGWAVLGSLSITKEILVSFFSSAYLYA
ncbi:hypothetical protein P3S68_032076 [Capsicum galapagoense]